MTIEQQVLDYISHYDQTPLYFKSKSVNKESISKLSINDLVMKVLSLTKRYSSYNLKTGAKETKINRRRSSLDIWRHCKYFQPDITIFQVMRSLYKLEPAINSNYCGFVYRRVFRITDNLLPLYLRGHEVHDEYKLLFSSWRDIGLDLEVQNGHHTEAAQPYSG